MRSLYSSSSSSSSEDEVLNHYVFIKQPKSNLLCDLGRNGRKAKKKQTVAKLLTLLVSVELRRFITFRHGIHIRS